MDEFGVHGNYGIEKQGLSSPKQIFWNLPPAILVEQIIKNDEGYLSKNGAVIVNTGKHTGRSPNDKYIVNPGSDFEKEIWWGKINCPASPDQYEKLKTKVMSYLQGKDVYVQDMAVGAHPDYQIPVRLITEKAWHSLFSNNLFRRLSEENIRKHIPEFTVICCPGFYASPELDGTRSGTFILLNFQKKQILIGGTAYAGEIKKAIFSALNFVLPRAGVLSMHCSANIGADDDVALFFGLSGTGKTTLSSSPDRRLIGDDEHGWSNEGVFNFEGGCYAKTIRLSPQFEPIIWHATQRFGALIENVVFNPITREIDFDDEKYTENTRGAYPLNFVGEFVENGYGGHPKNIFFLSADAFGVLPPISKLTEEQAIYYFLSGYTSKLAGTERDLGIEPQATFSTCFSAPFLPLYPNIYAQLLKDKIQAHKSNIWLINTGWTGGPYGVGHRFHLPYTRSLVKAALSGQLDNISFHQDPFFDLWIPDYCPDVPSEILNPKNTWNDPASYDDEAVNLISRFKTNFEQFKGTTAIQYETAGPG